MKYTVLALITLCFLVSCQQKQAENNQAADSTKPTETGAELYSAKEIYQEYFVNVPVTDFNPFIKQNITVTNPKETDKILTQLFPGKLCPKEITNESVSVVWKTSTKKTKKLDSFFDETEGQFEFPINEDGANETRFEDSFYYQINNTRYYAFFFSTAWYDGQVGFLRLGRFNCAILGVAVFRQAKNNWQLAFYNPALGCYGMFGTPNKPHKIQLGKQQYGFFITNGVAGGGAPYEANAYFYNLTDGVPLLFTVNDVVRNNTTISLWGFDVKTSEIENQPQYAININIEGFINDYNPDIEDVSGWPDEYKELAHKSGNYKFTHQQTFVPNAKGNYEFDDETFNYQTWPFDTIKGNAPNMRVGVYNQ
jgi:hypothetical protein